jgi:thiol-disulfide isomerase/thioredoxin
MPSVRRIAWIVAPALALFGALGLSSSPRADDSAGKDGVKLVSLKYDAFKVKVAEAKSKNYKYTLVDLWASNCGPCKENFPHLISVHQKYAPKGLQVMSLSLDDTSDAKAVESARKFLQEMKAPFLNVLLDEEYGVGFDKFDINAVPAVFVFDANGKQVRKYTLDDPNNQFTYDQVEKEVAELLSGKPATTR